MEGPLPIRDDYGARGIEDYTKIRELGKTASPFVLPALMLWWARNNCEQESYYLQKAETGFRWWERVA